MTDPFWLLVLIAAVGAGSFYAGWVSAKAYLNASLSVSQIASAAVERSNSYSSAMDKVKAETALLRAAVDQNTKVVETKLEAVEAAVVTLFQGFERAGIVRGARATPGRQVGETGPE